MQAEPEPVPRLGEVRNAGAVLLPALAAGRGQAVGRAVEHLDRAGILDGPQVTDRQVLARDADREVGLAVAVEVAPGERGAELVVLLDGVLDEGTVLVPELAAGRAQAAGRAVEHLDRAGV